jgi:formylglycine-generating enzyme required for sulfatase activity
LIPPGEFDVFLFEGKRRVRITKSFYLGAYEVTQAEYERVVGENPSSFKKSGNLAPVENVSWDDAQAFCKRLSSLREEQTQRHVYRLPTEAEWEYGLRAGSFRGWPSIDDYAWYPSNSQNKTHIVGQKKPNDWGLYDMLGNVWEWCLDWYAGSLSGGSVNDPKGPGSGSSRVVRGGSWRDDGSDCRSAPRGYYAPGFRGYGNVGFRAVLAAGQP